MNTHFSTFICENQKKFFDLLHSYTDFYIKRERLLYANLLLARKGGIICETLFTNNYLIMRYIKYKASNKHLFGSI